MKPQQESLFSQDRYRPLADRLRPSHWSEVVGQDHLFGPQGSLQPLLGKGHLPSMILWGPPGSGKTTIARLLAQETGLHFVALSAVFSGVADLRKVIDEARQRLHYGGTRTLLFVDEIHRFNRAQQDGFLGSVEDGTLTLVGATTENPSFALNSALLSRCQVFVLQRLADDGLKTLLSRAEALENKPLPLTAEARDTLIKMADGDGRYLLNLVEFLYHTNPAAPLDPASLVEALQQRAPLYDKNQESHYNLISALHKSLRASDVDAALYWTARMVIGGEDPNYIFRRLVRAANEDIGMADPHALTQALQTWQTYERLGSPEGELALAQCVVYLATAPKSNALYTAWKSALSAAKNTGSLQPPMHSLNAPTKLMEDIGYSEGYIYDHNTEEGCAGLNYFPPTLERQQFYQPTDRGFEEEIQKRLTFWQSIRDQQKDS